MLRGRDVYDTLFMPGRKFFFNENIFKTDDVKLPIKDTLVEYFNGLEKSELKRLANQVRPFLFKVYDADLIIKAPLYAKACLDNYTDGTGK